MILKSLDIYSEKIKENIRHVIFNESGLSLIVDKESNYSGSTIGKTTFVRCIDLCLGSRTHLDIYKDKETGTNHIVEAELLDKKMYSILTVNNNGKDIVLKRSLFGTGDQYIDGILFESIEDYREELKNRLFPNAPENLTFRQLITKFIRLGVNSESIFKYQDGRGSNTDYQHAYNYFFNLLKGDILEQKKNKLIENEKKKNSLNRKYHIRKKEKFYKLVTDKQMEYEFKKNEFLDYDYISEYGNQDEENIELIAEVEDATERIYTMKHKLQILEKRIEKENVKIFECDLESLNSLYNDVKGTYVELSKSFAQFIEFHNDMCNTRIASYKKEKEKINNQLQIEENNLNKIRENFSKKFTEFKSEVNEKSSSNFVEYYECKMEYDNTKNDYEYYISLLDEISNLNEEIGQLEEQTQVEDCRNDLNIIFENVTKEIIGEKYSFVFDDDENNMPISSDSIRGKIGSGYKKTLVAAVDFSFDEFFVEKKLNFPRFIIHDKMELAAVVDLKSVFDYCRAHSLQYIIPIMRDKIEKLDVTEKEIVLELSKTDKLFKF